MVSASVVVPVGYKQTEVGVIPDDWVVKPVGNVAKVVGGGTPSTEVQKYWNGDINWFTPTEVGSGKYVSESNRKLTNSGLQNSSASLLPKGTILLTSRAGIGNLGILESPSCTNQGFQSLIAFDNVDNEFLYYVLLTKRPELERKGSGSTFLEISPSEVKSLLIALPGPKEQNTISEVLSNIDYQIQNLESLISKMRDIKQGTMQEMLTGRTRLPGFNDEWKSIRLGELAYIKRGKLITKNQTVHGEIPVIAGGMVPAYFHNVSNRNGKTITISGSGANAGYVSFHKIPIFASDCSTIGESSEYSIEFIFFMLQYMQNQIYAEQTGGAQPHIYPSNLQSIRIWIPNELTEQEAIAEVLSDMDAEIAALEKRLEKAKTIKQGMMQQLLTGKIRLVHPQTTSEDVQ